MAEKAKSEKNHLKSDFDKSAKKQSS